MKNSILVLACVTVTLPGYAYVQPATVNPDNNSIIVLPAPETAFAPRPVITHPREVVLPALSGGFVIGLTGNYLAPSATHGDLNYASVNNASLHQVRKIDEGYYYGWGINVGYAFANTSNDINANYFHYDMDETNKFDSPMPDIAPFNSANLLRYHHIEAKANFNLDQADLTVGQYIDVGSRMRLHPLFGVRWVDFQRQMDHNFATPYFTSREAVRELSDFTGIGPLIGTDGEYEVGYNFGLVTHVDAALIVGNINSETHDDLFSNNFNLLAINNLDSNSIRRMVPVVDGKLGADYIYPFGNNSNAAIIFEAGYQVDEYFNAIDRNYFNNGILKTADFGLNGPYINVSYRTI